MGARSYVYLDGIRVLPYGQNDFDWLHIEQRRLLKATTYFFSSRRMIGYVALQRKENEKLSEKAGREGFRQNQAYRDLRAVLENWLTRVANDYFRENAELGEEYQEIKAGLKREAELLKRRSESVRIKRSEFVLKLAQMLEKIETRKPETLLSSLRSEFSNAIVTLARKPTNIIRDEISKLEEQSRVKLGNLLESFRLVAPRGFILSKPQERAFLGYTAWFSGFQSGEWTAAIDYVVSEISRLRLQTGISVDRQKRVSVALEASRNAADKIVRDLHKQAAIEISELDAEVKNLLRSRQVDFRNDMEKVFSSLADSDLNVPSETLTFAREFKLQEAIEQSLAEHKKLLEDLSEQFSSLRNDLKAKTTTMETVTFLESRIAFLEDELSAWRDLAQAGSAIGILGHETAQMAGGIRRGLSALKPWADATPDLRPIYQDLRNNFDHIDGLLGLFTPLGRRLRRQKRSIKGTELARYLRDAFGDRLQKEEISLEIKKSFEDLSLETYMSTLLAALVNILDNAIYWIMSEPRNDRRIWISASPAGILIGNSGPGIEHAIAENIFDFGISTKPDGRGMGLTVSRDALRSAGMDLHLLSRGRDTHPEFLIVTESAKANENASDMLDDGDIDESAY